MPMASRILVVVMIGALALAGCGRKEAPPGPPPPRVTVQPPRPSAVSAATYFNTESSLSLLVVRASELAMQRSANSGTRQIASRLMADHNGIAAQLSMAGRRLNLLPSASLLAPDRIQLDALSSDADFDTAYLRAMKSAVEICGRSHGDYAERGGSPTLRPIARFAATTCQDELRTLF